MVTNVEPDHLDYYGDFDRAGGGLRPLPGTGRVRGRGGGRRRRGGGRARRRATAPIWWGRRPAPPTASRTSTPATAVSFALRAARRVCSGASPCPSPGPTSPATRRWPWWPALRVGAPFDAAAARPGPLRRGGAALRVARRGERRALRGRLRPPAHRGGGRDRGGARHGPGRVWWWCSNPTATAASAALGGQFADAFAGADVVVDHRRVPRRRGAAAGGDGRIVADAVRGAHPAARRHLRARAVRAARRTWRTCSRPGDLCLTLGAGDLTSLPRRAAGDAAGGERGGRRGDRSDAAGARRRGRRRWAARADATPRSGRAPPTGWAGDAGGARRGARTRTISWPSARARWRAVRRAGPGARARRGLEPPRGRRRVPRCRGAPRAAGSPGSSIDGPVGAGRGPCQASRACAPARRRPDCTGSSGRWGCPGSVGGALRMNAGGHGSDIAAVLAGCARLRPAPPGEPRKPVPRRSPSATGARRARRRAGGGVGRVRPVGRRSAAAAEADGGRDRALAPRANQPGGSNAGSVFVNPPGTRRAGWWSGGPEGAAAGDGPGVDEARQLHPGRPGRVAPTTCGAWWTTCGPVVRRAHRRGRSSPRCGWSGFRRTGDRCPNPRPQQEGRGS